MPKLLPQPGKRVKRKPLGIKFTSSRNKVPVEKSSLSSHSSLPEVERTLVCAGYRCSETIPTAPIGSSDNRFYWNVEIFGKHFAALIDPGAVASLLGPKAAALVATKITPTNAHMTLPNGQLEKILGKVEMKFLRLFRYLVL